MSDTDVMDTRPYLGAIDFAASDMNRHDLDALLELFLKPDLLPFVYRRIGEVLERAFSSTELSVERLAELELDERFYAETAAQLAAVGTAPRSAHHEQCARVRRWYEDHPKLWGTVLSLPVIGARLKPRLELLAKRSYSYEAQRSIASRLHDLVTTIPYRVDLVRKQSQYTEREEEVEFYPSGGGVTPPVAESPL
jgi:hypothetical protein